MSAKFNYIDGVTIAICRRLVKYAFGKDRVLKVEKNLGNMSYDIYLKKTIDNEEVDSEIVDYFKEYWGRGFDIFIVDIK